MQAIKKRGLFIVFEGIDRVGKSTQCEMLTQWFNTRNEPTQRIVFPGI
jgi:thymidylate kinase